MELFLSLAESQSRNQRETSYRFDESGGTIGRSARNDWILSDPDRYVSERHARIDYRDGRFILTDLSTNGTYLNDSEDRIPRNDGVVLRTGDRLYMGNFRIRVTIPDEESGSTRIRGRAGGSERPPREGTIPQSRHPGGRSHPREAEAVPERPEIPEEWFDLLAGFFEPESAGRRAERSRSPRRERKAAGSHDGLELAEAIFEELGMRNAARQVNLDDFGRDVGRILRMVTEGLMQALQTRSEIKRKFRIEQTEMRTAGNNPLKASPDLETALRRLFVDQEGGAYLSGAPALREAFDDLHTHELAILAAVHATIESVIANFDPGPLKAKLRQVAPVSSATPVLGNAKCWSLYEDHYQEVAAQLRDDARLGFLKEFANAYEKATKRLRARSDADRSDR